MDSRPCPTCGQRAFRYYLGKRVCTVCSYRETTSFGMLAISVAQSNRLGEEAS